MNWVSLEPTIREFQRNKERFLKNKRNGTFFMLVLDAKDLGLFADKGIFHCIVL